MAEPFRLTLMLTRRCNHACEYCYVRAGTPETMSLYTATSALELALKGHEAIDLAFFGGEPLLESALLFTIARLARQRTNSCQVTLRQSLTTNGSLLDDTTLVALAQLGIRMTVSIDATEQAHDRYRRGSDGSGTYADAMSAARRVVQQGQRLDVMVVISPGVSLAAGVRELLEVGASRITMVPALELPWQDEDLLAIETELDAIARIYIDCILANRHIAITPLDLKLELALRGGLIPGGCERAQRSWTVDPGGVVYTCDRPAASMDKRFALGHISGGQFEPKDGQSFTTPDNESPQSMPAACAQCAERWRCEVHCGCANVAETGEPSLPGGVRCWFEQAFARAADAVGAQLLAKGSSTFLEWAYADLVPYCRPPAAGRMLPVVR